MTVLQKISTAILVLLLTAAGVAWWKTAPPTAKMTRQRAATLAAAELVDQSTYTTAQRLARLAETPDEQVYAQSALRVADHALAFAFTTALRDAEAHPPVLSPEAVKIQDRIRKSQGLLDSDQQRVTELTGSLAQAKTAQKDALQDELDLAAKNQGKNLPIPNLPKTNVLLHGNVAVAYGISSSTSNGKSKTTRFADSYLWEHGTWHVFFAQQTRMENVPDAAPSTASP